MTRIDRRASARIQLPEAAIWIDSGFLDIVRAVLLDISLGGAKFSCPRDLSLRDLVDLELRPSTTDQIKLPVIITGMRSQSGSDTVYGAKFVALSSEKSAALQAILHRGGLKP